MLFIYCQFTRLKTLIKYPILGLNSKAKLHLFPPKLPFLTQSVEIHLIVLWCSFPKKGQTWTEATEQTWSKDSFRGITNKCPFMKLSNWGKCLCPWSLLINSCELNSLIVLLTPQPIHLLLFLSSIFCSCPSCPFVYFTSPIFLSS